MPPRQRSQGNSDTICLPPLGHRLEPSLELLRGLLDQRSSRRVVALRGVWGEATHPPVPMRICVGGNARYDAENDDGPGHFREKTWP